MLSEELRASIVAALEQSGQLSLEEIRAKIPDSTEAKIRSALSALVDAKKVRRSPRGMYYVHGHVVSPVPPPKVRGGRPTDKP
jgi:DeoR/GlpR family transcriptional regulator of sugar metabolism